MFRVSLVAVAVSGLAVGSGCKRQPEEKAKPVDRAESAKVMDPTPPAESGGHKVDNRDALALQKTAAGSYNVDAEHSNVLFRIKHLDVAYFHGRFNKVTGTLKLDALDPSKSSVTIEIDANSVFTANKKRDDHLRSPDFLSAAEFPAIGFASKSVELKPDGSLGVVGDLSLHGVTRSITATLAHVGAGKDPWGGFRTGFEGTFSINRSDYGIKFMPGGVGEQIDLTVAIEAIRQ